MAIGKMVVRQRRGVLGWFFLALFALWNLACGGWAFSVVVDVLAAASSGDAAQRLGAGLGGSLSFITVAAVWLTGAVVLGLSALLFGSRTMTIDIVPAKG